MPVNNLSSLNNFQDPNQAVSDFTQPAISPVDINAIQNAFANVTAQPNIGLTQLGAGGNVNPQTNPFGFLSNVFAGDLAQRQAQEAAQSQANANALVARQKLEQQAFDNKVETKKLGQKQQKEVQKANKERKAKGVLNKRLNLGLSPDELDPLSLDDLKSLKVKTTKPNTSITDVTLPDGSIQKTLLTYKDGNVVSKEPIGSPRKPKNGFTVFDEKGNPIVTTGDAGSVITKSQSGKQQVDLQEFEIATRQALSTANELKNTVAETPEALGASGELTKTLEGWANQARNFANITGVEVAASLDPNKYDFEKAGIGSQNAVLKSNAVKLAFAAASASGQTGKSVSDKDVERFLEQIGAGLQSPKQFSRVIDSFTNGLKKDFRIRYNVINGKPFTGTLDENGGQTSAVKANIGGTIYTFPSQDAADAALREVSKQ